MEDEEWAQSGGPNAKPEEVQMSDEDVQNLAIAYEMLTSKRASPDLMIDEAMQELMDLKHDLRHLARIYNFKGDMETIFSTLIVDELTPFSVDVLLVYLDYMHLVIDDHLRQAGDHRAISIAIFDHHVRRLQRMRTLTYVEALFFGNPDDRERYRPGVFHVRDNDAAGVIPLEDETLAEGPKQWFPQMGCLTVSELRRCFDFHQTFHILMIAGSMAAGDVNKEDVGSEVRWNLTNLTGYEEIANALIATYDSMKFDPRMYLTLSGPASRVVYEQDDIQLSLNQDLWFGYELDSDEIISACESEGIEVINDGEVKTLDLLFEEYVLAQMSPTFISHPGNHTTRMSASKFVVTPSGQDVVNLEEDDLVYYGVRDGDSKLTVYTIQELYEAFSSGDSLIPFDPSSVLTDHENIMRWKIFSKKSIRRLLSKVLPRKRRCAWTPRLAAVCQVILSSEETREFELEVQERCLRSLINLDRKKKLTLSATLTSMYNAGSWLLSYEEKIASYDDSAFTEFLIRNPASVPGEPETTGRPQAEVRDILMYLEDDIAKLEDDAHLFNRLLIVKSEGGEETPFAVAYDDANYQLSEYIKFMRNCRFGLTKMYKSSARWLMVTSSVYHKKLFGHLIGDIELEFEETTEDYENFTKG